LQIISKKGSKKIFNCSSKIIIETPSICEPCKDLEFFEDIKTCLNLEVKKHFYETLNFNLLNNLDNIPKSVIKNDKDIELYLYKEVELFIQFAISEEGKLNNKKTKVPTVFKSEVLKVLESFPIIKQPGTFNGVENKPMHSFTITYKNGEKPVYKDKNLSYIDFSKPSTENKLSLFYSEKLSKEFIQNANLNSINNRLVISFELDRKNTLFNVKSSARSISLNKEIISIFKEYPIKNLNFTNRSPYNNYILQILSFTDNEIIVNTDSIIGYERVPVFPGCENSKSVSDAKSCFSKGVQMHFMKKFDADLPNRLGLNKGRKRVFISFKINNKGSVFKIIVKAPHKKIKEEVVRVMQTLPKVIPAIQRDEKVNIKYSIPFTLIVE
jgi:hypothetical protein